MKFSRNIIFGAGLVTCFVLTWGAYSIFVDENTPSKQDIVSADGQSRKPSQGPASVQDSPNQTSVVTAAVARNTPLEINLSSLDIVDNLNAKNGDIEAALREEFGLSEDHTFLSVKEKTDMKGNTHTRFRQNYKGIPIWGKQIITHKNVEGEHYRVTGSLYADLDGQSLDSKVASLPGRTVPVEVIETVKNINGHDNKRWKIENKNNELFIYIDEFQGAVPAYFVSYFASPSDASDQDYSLPTSLLPTRPHFLVDTQSGEMLASWEGLAHARREGTGPGGNIKTGVYYYGVDKPPLEIEDIDGLCYLDNDNVSTISLEHSEERPFSEEVFSFPCLDNSYKKVNGGFSPLNDAHYFSGVAHSMYQDWFNNAPLSSKLKAKVHYGEYFTNAFWTGSEMVFGDGGITHYPLTTLGVVTHEASHGVTEQNSGLIYQFESGGMNEAFSDIAGEAAEFYLNGSVDWLHGTFRKSTAVEVSRFFEDPTRDGRSIKSLDDFVLGMNVHHSSGLYNHVYYQLSTTPGWDPKKAFEVFYLANINYWSPDETFLGGACGVLFATQDLGYDPRDVDDAFKVAGIDCGSVPFTDNDGDGMDDNWELANGLDPNNRNDPNEFQDDLLSHLEEYRFRSDPHLSDTDGDGLGDYEEVFNHLTSPILADTDGDGVSDSDEIALGLNPQQKDSDDDGLNDGWEIQHGFNPLVSNDGNLDSDGDGLSDSDELANGSDPNLADTDNDGLSDGEEIQIGTSPIRADTDYDGISDFIEVNDLAVDPTLADSDGDFLTDADEYALGTDPTNPDTDGDGLGDGVEIEIHQSNPLVADSDGDGMPDAWEVLAGLNLNIDDANLDLDADSLVNIDEFIRGTDASIPDTDGDLLTDGDEVNIFGTDPTRVDSDLDTMPDGWEVQYGFNPLVNEKRFLDEDGDGWFNGQEAVFNTNPFSISDKPHVPTNIVLHPVSDSHSCTAISCRQNSRRVYAGWYASSQMEVRAHLEIELPQNPWIFSQVNLKLRAFSGSSDIEETTSLFDVNTDFENVENFSQQETRAAWDDLGSGVTYGDDVASSSANATYILDFPIPLLALNLLRERQQAFSVGIKQRDIAFGSIDGYQTFVVGWANLHVSYEPDTDDDGINDSWEILHSLDINDPTDALADNDNDGLINLQEFVNRTDPFNRDTDFDGLSDGTEVVNGFDPNEPTDIPAGLDRDGDGLTNEEEILLGTNPDLADTDGDGLTDGDEVIVYQTDPVRRDSDGDGLDDSEEIFTFDSDPLTANTEPLVTISSFTEDQLLTGSILFEGSAWHRSRRGIRVELFLGDELLATVDTNDGNEWAFDFDTSYWQNGDAQLIARAFSRNEQSADARINVRINNTGAAQFNPIIGTPYCGLSFYCDSLDLLIGRGGITNGREVNRPNTLLSSRCADGNSGRYRKDESLERIRIQSIDGLALAPGVRANVEITMFAWAGFREDFVDIYYSSNADADSPTWTFLETLRARKSGEHTLSAEILIPDGSDVHAVRGIVRHLGSPAICETRVYTDHDDLVFVIDNPTALPNISIKILSPREGRRVRRVVRVAGVFSQTPVVQAQLELFVDGVRVSADFSYGNSGEWSTRLYVAGFSDGQHTMTVSGLVSGQLLESSISVMFRNAR